MHPEFTLTELLVVTATIGVVGAAVLTGAGGQNTRVDKAVFKSDLRSAAMTAVQNSLNLETPHNLCLEDESLRNILHKIFTDAGAGHTHFLTASSAALNAHFIAEYPNGTFVTETGHLNAVDDFATTITHGCASDQNGWVLWGKLSENPATYACLDSEGFSATGIATDLTMPNTLRDLERAACENGDAGIGK